MCFSVLMKLHAQFSWPYPIVAELSSLASPAHTPMHAPSPAMSKSTFVTTNQTVLAQREDGGGQLSSTTSMSSLSNGNLAALSNGVLAANPSSSDRDDVSSTTTSSSYSFAVENGVEFNFSWKGALLKMIFFTQ